MTATLITNEPTRPFSKAAKHLPTTFTLTLVLFPGPNFLAIIVFTAHTLLPTFNLDEMALSLHREVPQMILPTRALCFPSSTAFFFLDLALAHAKRGESANGVDCQLGADPRSTILTRLEPFAPIV